MSIMPKTATTPSAPDTEDLHSFATKHELRLVTADGPNADLLTQAVLAGNTLVVPPGQDPTTTLDQAREALANQTTVCPDGITWCAGDPREHTDPREHIHNSPERTITGPYGKDILGFHLAQWGNDRPFLAFVGSGDWPGLGLEETDQLIADMSQQLDRLKAARNQLAALTQEPAAEPGTWTIALRGGGQITGYQPTWCTEEHDEHNLDPNRARLSLTDLTHVAFFDGVPLKVYSPGYASEGNGGVYKENVLSGNIAARPYDDDPARRNPVVNLEILEDFWMENLGPDELADVIAKLRQQADRLDGVHTQLLQARAEWAAQQ